MQAHSCWRCGQDNGEQEQAPSLFCAYCNSLQAPTPDYFRFFGLGKRLSVDIPELQRRFYDLSRVLHPDRYTRRPERERSYSLEATAILNDGYRVLRDPVRRAEYVLREAGFEIGAQRTKDVPPELLEEVFELNMALDELRSGDEDVIPQLRESRERFVGMQNAIDGELQEQFERHDAAADDEGRREALLAIRGILNRRRYIENLLSEVDKELVARGS
jgi:molecular chaperone HscB